MAKTEKPSRYPVHISEETKRRLSVLAADANEGRESYGGKLLTEAVDRSYAEYVRRLGKHS